MFLNKHLKHMQTTIEADVFSTFTYSLATDQKEEGNP